MNLKIKLLIVSFLFTLGNSFSQAPEKMSYQSVLRGTNNALVTNQNVFVKISILQGTISGTSVYVETHSTSTNSNGLVSLSIGGGTAVSGSFSGINWANGPYFVQMEADPTGGTNYTISGTTQLLSVPYALYAKTSGSSTPGPTGAQGIQGVAGINGTNGLNAIIKTTSEPAGSNCINGGTKIETGLDANANGVLDVVEVNTLQSQFVCNGVSGSDGNGASSHGTWTNSAASSFIVPSGINTLVTNFQGASAGAGGSATFIGNYTYSFGGGAGGSTTLVKLLILNLNEGDIVTIDNNVSGNNSDSNVTCLGCGTGCNISCTGGIGESSNSTNLYLNGTIIATISGASGGGGGIAGYGINNGGNTGAIGTTGQLTFTNNGVIQISQTTSIGNSSLIIEY